MKFSEATTEEELIATLKAKASNLQNSVSDRKKYIYHYTDVEAVIKILKKKKWYLGSPNNMNDRGESNYLSKVGAKNLFFASYLAEENESIAMWGMYSQPWEKGVAIRIPAEMMKKWISFKPDVYEAIPGTKDPGSIINDAAMQFHFIAYTNMYAGKSGCHWICGDQKNDLLGGASTSLSLAGYVKDIVWEYEKELRLRVAVDPAKEYEAVLVDVPQEVLDSFEFISGPRFSENLLKRFRDEIDAGFSESRVIPSTFTGRLNWVYCDSCSFRKSS